MLHRTFRTLGIALPWLVVVWCSSALAGQGEQEKRLRELEKQRAQDRKEIQDLRKRVKGLESDRPPQPQQPQQEDEITRILNAFNPRLTVFGNFVGRIDDRTVRNEDGDRIDDRFNLREVELDFRAAIDNWADGVLILTVESEVPGEFETGVEEGYVVLRKIPGLDAAPWGLQCKVGKFRPEFGRFNRIHTHDLPQTTRPLALRTFLGEEGFVQDGIAASFSVPTCFESSDLGVTLQVLNGGGIAVGEDNSGNDPAYAGRVKWFQDLGGGHDCEVGASWWVGKADELGMDRAYLAGLDFTYKWKPFEAGEWNSVLIGGELYYASIETTGSPTQTPIGGFAWAQYQFTKNLYLGGRFDYTEDLATSSMEDRAASAWLSWYTTEFLRFRLGYEHLWGDTPEVDGLDTVFFELNFVFGSHPAEPYWVNR